MLFISILYAIAFLQMVKALLDPSTVWYREPKFWLQLVTVLILTTITMI